MSNHTNNTNNADEIDLIKLFSYFAKGIGNFFKAIGNIFKGIFHVFILLLLLLQKNIIYFIVAIVLGIVAGLYLDYSGKPFYTADMVVEPNFESTKELYNQVAYFNELAASGDKETLAKEMGITVQEAGNVTGVDIKALYSERQKLRLYDRFIKQLDTLTRRSFTYQEFSENFNEMDAIYHTIKVTTVNDAGIARKMQNAIVSSVTTNPYFKLQQQSNNDNLEMQDTLIRKQLKSMDSLEKVYMETMILMADSKSTAGTNINLANNSLDGKKEINLFEQEDIARSNLSKLYNDKASTKSTINVIAEFPKRGLKVSGVTKSKKIILPILFVTIVFVVLLLLRLNVYLRKYKV